MLWELPCWPSVGLRGLSGLLFELLRIPGLRGRNPRRHQKGTKRQVRALLCPAGVPPLSRRCPAGVPPPARTSWCAIISRRATPFVSRRFLRSTEGRRESFFIVARKFEQFGSTYRLPAVSIVWSGATHGPTPYTFTRFEATCGPRTMHFYKVWGHTWPYAIKVYNVWIHAWP